MKVPSSFLSATAVLGSTLLLVACGGGSDSSIVGAEGGSSGGSATAPSSASSGITAANMNAVAAHVAKATSGSTNQSNGTSDSSTTGPDIALAAANQIVTAQTVQAVAQLPSITLNCNQGGTATIQLETASRSRITAGDRLTLNASNCVQDNDRVNGGVRIDVNSLTGKPSSTDPWSGTFGVTFTGFTHDDGEDVDDLDGDIALTINQTARGVGTFEVSGNSLTFADNKGGATVSRTLTAFSTTGSVNVNVFTYRANFTLAGGIPDVGPGPFTINTTQDFVQQRGSAPSQGALVVRASDNSTLTLTAMDSTNVTLAADVNGDGTVDATRATTWTELRESLL